MGFLRRLFGVRDDAAVPAHEQPSFSRSAKKGRAQGRVSMSVSTGNDQPLVQLTGTTTFAKVAIAALARRHGIVGSGYLETTGSLQREPDNAADPHAVVVLVDGERIGYLPGYIARTQVITAKGARAIQVQIFYEMLPRGLRAEAWTWLGDGLPQWQWSSSNRPPMSSKAKAAAHQDSINEMVDEALAEGGTRASSFEAGMVNGVHYLQLIEPIKQLKRDGRLEEALVLCTAAIEGAENAREGREPAPGYTEQAAIIHRKLGHRDEEIAVLRRWLKVCPPEHREGSRIKERLDKLVG